MNFKNKSIKLCDTTAIRNWNCRPWYCVWCMTITISTYFFLCVSFSFNFIHFVMFCSLNHINKLCKNLCIWNCYYFIKNNTQFIYGENLLLDMQLVFLLYYLRYLSRYTWTAWEIVTNLLHCYFLVRILQEQPTNFVIVWFRFLINLIKADKYFKSLISEVSFWTTTGIRWVVRTIFFWSWLLIINGLLH